LREYTLRQVNNADARVQCDEKKPTCSRCARLPELCKYELKLSWTGGRPFKKPRKEAKGGGYGITPTTYTHTLDLRLNDNAKGKPQAGGLRTDSQIAVPIAPAAPEKADAASISWDINQEFVSAQEDNLVGNSYDTGFNIGLDDQFQDVHHDLGSSPEENLGDNSFEAGPIIEYNEPFREDAPSTASPFDIVYQALFSDADENLLEDTSIDLLPFVESSRQISCRCIDLIKLKFDR
jgi:hypothetical protein